MIEFPTGKFEQFNVDSPYLAIIQACNKIVEKILMMRESEIQEFKV